MNVAFHYLYRDGNNFKKSGTAVFSNPDGERISPAEAGKRLVAAMEEGMFFIAEQVGIPDIFLWNPHLVLAEDGSTEPEDLAEGYAYNPASDHCWHEFDGTEQTKDGPTDPRTIRRFVEEVEHASATGWKVFDPAGRQEFPFGGKILLCPLCDCENPFPQYECSECGNDLRAEGAGRRKASRTGTEG